MFYPAALKNQALCEYCTHGNQVKNIANTLIIIIIIISLFPLKSHEKRLITKEHIVTDMHLTLVFKWAVRISTLALKLFNSGTQLFQTINVNGTL